MIAFSTGVLLAAAFLTGAGGPGAAVLLLLAMGAAIVVLTVRTWRWAVRHAAEQASARAAVFGVHALPQTPATEVSGLPA